MCHTKLFITRRTLRKPLRRTLRRTLKKTLRKTLRKTPGKTPGKTLRKTLRRTLRMSWQVVSLVIASLGLPPAISCSSRQSALAPCPGEGPRYGDFKCDHDRTHR